MLYFNLSFALLAAGSAKIILAHTTFTNFYVDGVNQGDGVAVRMNNNPGKATFPIDSITSPSMACGVNGEKGVARVAAIKPGSTITFEWRDHPDGSAPGAIDISHKGPCAVYMKKVDNSAANNNAAGDGWFKIMELGYDQASQKWCTEQLEANNGHLAASVPKNLAPGYYLMRPELLALHQADKNPPDPQFYVGCAQVFLASGGSAEPKDTVSIPGYVSLSTPAMTYNVWRQPLPMPFPDFGPPLYESQQSKSRFAKRAMAQVYGLKPAKCAMANANWCAALPPSYSDQDGCWAASKDCYAQLTTCYNSAPPTGSKGCKSWESYCKQLQNQCGSANYQGPPPCKDQLPGKPAPLTGGVVSASGPMPSASVNQDDKAGNLSNDAKYGTQGEKSRKATSSQSYAAPMSPEKSPAQASKEADNVAEPISIPTAYPVPSGNTGAVKAGTNKSSDEGSIDECGSRNGQKCKTGMCCSSHSYCGTSDEYCGDGCQSQYGSCSSSKHTRSPLMRRHLMHGRGFKI